MRHIFLTLYICLAALCPAVAQTLAPELAALGEESVNFYIANDLGRNGYYEQRSIAERMGQIAEQVDIEFVAAPGDVHHFEGVASVNDPLWMTNYELIYAHPELMLPWYPLLGNHEYRGNTQAVLDYSRVSRRWEMPGRYYAKDIELEGDGTLRLIFIDTTPLIDKYRDDSTDYADAHKQDRDAQLRWLEAQLQKGGATWTVVLGHHPVFAQTSKNDTERTDMQRYVKPLLDKYKVDAYVCGHIHNFQHIKPAQGVTDYLVNSSGSLARSVAPIEGTLFCSDRAGFTLVSATPARLTFFLMNGKGEILHRIVKEKRVK